MTDEFKPALEQIQSRVCALSKERILNWDGAALRFNSVDSAILKLSRRAVNMGGEFCFVYPVRQFNLLPFIALEWHYVASDRDRSVLVITKNQMLFREQYASLWLDPSPVKQGFGTNIHHSMFPMGYVDSFGSIKRIMGIVPHVPSKRRPDPKILISRGIETLPSSLCNIDGAIIDLRDFNFQEIEKIRKKFSDCKIKNVLYFETDPYSRELELILKLNIPVWGWSDAALKQDIETDIKTMPSDLESGPLSLPFKQMRIRIGAEFEREHKELTGSFPNEALDGLWKYVENMRADGKTSDLAKIANALLINVSYNFEKLTAPVEFYEKSAGCSFYLRTRPFREKLEGMNRLIERLKSNNPTLADYYGGACSDAEKCLSEFSKRGTPKFDLLLQFADAALRGKETMLVVCPDRMHSAATDLAIKDKFQFAPELTNFVKVCALSDIDGAFKDKLFSICVFSGPLPRYKRYVLRYCLGKKNHFMCYEREKRSLLWQIREDNEFVERLFGKTNRKVFLEKIKLHENEKVQKDAEKIFVKAANVEGDRLIKLSPLDAGNLMESREDSDSMLDILSIGDIDSTVETESGNIEIPCIKLNFNDGSFITKRKDSYVQILDIKDDVKYVLAEKIRTGDNVVIIGDAQSLTEHIFQKIQDHPRLRAIVLKCRAWIDLLSEALASSGDTAEDCLKKMQEKGTDIKTPTAIYFWVRGFVLCPRNKENIRYIGEIYNIPYLKEDYKDVYAAMSRVKKIHRNIIIELRKVLPAFASKHATSDGIIDEEFEITIEDFREGIYIKQVIGAEETVASLQTLNKLQSG